jgi:hypothetical protein
VFPSYFIVIVEEAFRPFPVIVTVVPMPPFVGLSVMDDVTVKVAEADLELASVIVTVLAPAVEAGTMKVAPVKEPVASVVVVPLSVTPEPAKVAVIVEEAVNPVPETVTDVPTLPLDGFNMIFDITVYVACAELGVGPAESENTSA